MRTYGLTLYERTLESVMALFALSLLVLCGLSLAFAAVFDITTPADGARVAVLALAGVLCGLGGAGIRQNRAVSRLALGTLVVASAWWITRGFIGGSGWSVAMGMFTGLGTWLIGSLFRRATKARFRPRYFSMGQFETLIQMADAVLDSDGEAALSPLQVAVNIDHFIASFEAPVRQQMRLVLVMLEWLLPLLMTFRPFPFSMLGSAERRRVIERVIGKQGPMGLFRDIARTLKLLTFAGYYGSPEGMAQVGYVPFEQRQRSQGADQTPHHHSDPFITATAAHANH